MARDDDPSAILDFIGNISGHSGVERQCCGGGKEICGKPWRSGRPQTLCSSKTPVETSPLLPLMALDFRLDFALCPIRNKSFENWQFDSWCQKKNFLSVRPPYCRLMLGLINSYSGLETFCGSLWDNISFLVPCARLSPD